MRIYQIFSITITLIKKKKYDKNDNFFKAKVKDLKTKTKNKIRKRSLRKRS